MTSSKPVALAVIVSLMMLVSLMILTVAIGGSYALTLHTLNVAEQNRASANVRQMKAALASAKGECVALETLDHARNGITFPNRNLAHPSELYLSRMTASIHTVVVKSGCSYIIRGKFPPGESPPGG